MAARNKHNPQLVAPAGTTSQRTSGSLIARSLMVVALIASALFAAAFVTAQENTPEASSTPDGTPAATPSAEMPRLELELEELNDSGIEGTVTLFDAGERTIVEFDVEGAGGDHPANISAGVCGDLEPEPAHELEPIDENGESLTVVEVTLDELLESEHAIDVRLAPDQLGTLIACANIEGEPEVPVAGTPEATAEATPTGEGGQVATETPDVTVASTETPEATTEATVETAATTEAVTTPESSPTDGTGGTVNAGEPGATIPLRELNDSGVTGTVTLSSQGEATRISIQIEGDAVTGDHIAHLHSGTCEAPGEYTYTLNPVSEEGTSETVVNITLDELLTGGYMVNVHPSEANWDAWMVCGELVETTTATATVTPAATTEAGGQITTPAETPTATTPATTTPSTTTPVIPVQTIPPAPTGDGTSGVTGVVTTDTSVQTLPQTAGVGAMLEWPSDPRTAILWATTGAAIILAAAALVIRRGERQTTTTPSRWTRLGI